MRQQDMWRAEVAKAARTLQIIVAAVTAGPIFFLAIALVIGQSQPGPPAGQPPLLTWLAGAVTIVLVIARMIVPSMVLANGRKNLVGTGGTPAGSPTRSADELAESNASRLMSLLQTKTIVAAALLEGAAFFQLVVYIVETNPLSLIVAAFLILGIAMLFPTPSGVVRWIEDELRRLDQEREFAR